MHRLIAARTHDRSRGDTLVEVLIAMAVISLMLGGAYVTTNKSLQATRAAQERSIALKLGESQIERLKGLMATPAGASAAQAISSPFCISPSTSLPVAVSGTVCDFGTNGTASNAVEPVFHISITRSGDDFALTETWFNVGGQNTDSLQLRYRVYD